MTYTRIEEFVRDLKHGSASAINQIIEEGDLQDLVNFGGLLWELGELARKAMDPIKEHLRQEATKQRDENPNLGAKPIRFQGSNGWEAEVVAPFIRVQLRPGADPSALTTTPERRNLLDSLFQGHQPCRDFIEVFQKADRDGRLDEDMKEAILNLVDVNTSTPRVSFKEC